MIAPVQQGFHAIWLAKCHQQNVWDVLLCHQVKGEKPPAATRGLTAAGGGEEDDEEEEEGGGAEEEASVLDLVPRNDIRYEEWKGEGNGADDWWEGLQLNKP